MVPLYTNILKPSEYGEIDLILSIISVISPFVACGIHEGVMRFSLDKDADTKMVLSIGLRIFMLSSVVFILICPLFKFVPIVSQYVEFIYLYIILNEIMTIFLCYIRGMDNIKLYSFLGFFSGFLTAFLNILFLVVFKLGLFGYKISILLSPFITTIFAIIIGNLSKDISIKKWKKSLAIDMLKYSLILIPNSILWWCINASDRFFVSYMCSTADNGIYAMSYKIPTLLNTVSTIFMQSWQMSAIREYENKEGSEFCNQIYKLLIFFMGLATLILLLINKSVLNIYVGYEYRSAWIYSPFLMISFFAGSLGTFWGSFYIASKKMNKYLQSALFGALVNIILNFLLIKQVGTIGAAIATMVSYIVVLIARARGIRKQINLKFINKEILSSTVCLIFGIIISYFSNSWLWILGLINISLYLIYNKDQIIILINFFETLIGNKKGC